MTTKKENLFIDFMSVKNPFKKKDYDIIGLLLYIICFMAFGLGGIFEYLSDICSYTVTWAIQTSEKR